MTNEERALHGMVYHLEAAWNAADSAAFAALFAEDADFVHILGGYYTGRAAIEAGHRMIFGTIYKGSTVRYSVEKIRLPSSGLGADLFCGSICSSSKMARAGTSKARPTIVRKMWMTSGRSWLLQNTLDQPRSASADDERRNGIA